MSKNLNPNPRTWRSPKRGTIIDLKQVTAITYDSTKGTIAVYLKGSGSHQAIGTVSQSGPLRMGGDAEKAKSLMDAFEMYRSAL